MPPSFVSFRPFGVRELDRARRFGVDISMEVIPLLSFSSREKNRGRKLGILRRISAGGTPVDPFQARTVVPNSLTTDLPSPTSPVTGTDGFSVPARTVKKKRASDD